MKPGSASAALCNVAGDAERRSKACRLRRKIGKGREKAHPPQEAVLEGQDKADFSWSQKCRYVFVCTSFFREIVYLGAYASERLSGLLDARNG
jgi:hypothetical protein